MRQTTFNKSLKPRGDYLHIVCAYEFFSDTIGTEIAVVAFLHPIEVVVMDELGTASVAKYIVNMIDNGRGIQSEIAIQNASAIGTHFDARRLTPKVQIRRFGHALEPVATQVCLRALQVLRNVCTLHAAHCELQVKNLE